LRSQATEHNFNALYRAAPLRMRAIRHSVRILIYASIFCLFAIAELEIQNSHWLLFNYISAFDLSRPGCL